jgi:hypothetical protein
VPDYTPVALPGGTWTFTASTALTGGDVVEVTGANAVGKVSTLASTKVVGIAGHDAPNGAKVTITLTHAVHESVADGSITAGDQLTSSAAANRQVKALAPAALNVDVTGTPSEATIEAFNPAINTAVNQARAVIGVALTTVADNALVRWVQWR